MHDTTISPLPIEDYQEEIVSTVENNQVTIIVAETGAGKSTQVPQYLAGAGYEKVIVTQPRILAARNLAQRVRSEHEQRTGMNVPDFAAYRTAYERDDTPDTTILYCTDGLQLVREITGSGIREKQILILDEVHEWNENMEVLVAWAKKRCQEDPHFKVVIMSATIEADTLAAYFGTIRPIVVPGRMHEVTWRRGVDVVYEIEKKLEAANATNMLVFLPGKSEIEDVTGRVFRQATAAGVPVIPLHGQLEPDMQQKAFLSYPRGKIILSTNVAQTSVTIEDIDVVIDAGLERRTEVKDGVQGLFIGQTSRADCMQRAGRAGRTKKGEYILAPFGDMPCMEFDDRSAYPVPEIMRGHIDRLVLRLASSGIDIEELEFYHSPSRGAIKRAKRTLRALGALGSDGGITTIGRKMEQFPVESSYARMLVESQEYDQPIRAILATVIAVQEVGGITRGGTRYMGWRRFTSEMQSDLLAQYDVLRHVIEIDSDDYDDLGVIAKNVEKAIEVSERLRQDIGIVDTLLQSIGGSDRDALLRCIVAGQIDQLWTVNERGEAVHLDAGGHRELSSSSVVVRPKLFTGSAFDLQIPTSKGLEVLHLVQGITLVEPDWLVQLAPDLFAVKPGKTYYDEHMGSLAKYQLIRYNGKTFEGPSIAVTDPTKENRRLFAVLYAKSIYEDLERERRFMHASHGHKIPQIPLRSVEQRVKMLLGGVLSIRELAPEQKRALEATGQMKSYLDERSRVRMEATSHKTHPQKQTWRPGHKRRGR